MQVNAIVLPFAESTAFMLYSNDKRELYMMHVVLHCNCTTYDRQPLVNTVL
jgi:hypothetical protein